MQLLPLPLRCGKDIKDVTMNKHLLWIWLRLALKSDIKMMYALYEVAGSVVDIFNADRKLLDEWGVSDRFRASLLDKRLTKAHNILGQCEQFDLSILCIEDEDYPVCLREIALPPCLLFYQGDLFSCINGPALTVIGTRHSTATGEALASEFAHHLAVAGFAIFCGVAEGIEAAVHKACISADGKCVLFLPGGLLTANKYVSRLIREVLPHGAVVSECFPTELGGRNAYQIRNRLLCAFTPGTLILQAPAKSGALMTASYALEQGKDVFVLPGGLKDPSFTGNNRLLRDGAIPSIAPEDIVEYYKPKWEDALQSVVIEDDVFEGYITTVTEGNQFDDEEEQIIFCAITPEGITSDEIAVKTGLPVQKILAKITLMEFKGWIAPLPGGKYKTII